MTVKKTLSLKRPAAAPVADANDNAADAPATVAPPTGGATIADRFKLDLQDPSAKKGSGGGKAATVAAIAGFIALIVAGVLTFIIYQHWEFLKGA